MNAIVILAIVVIFVLAILAIVCLGVGGGHKQAPAETAQPSDPNAFVRKKAVAGAVARLEDNPEPHSEYGDPAQPAGRLNYGDCPEMDDYPTLLQEYVNPETSASRKMQIACMLRGSISYFDSIFPALMKAAEDENRQLANSRSIREEMSAEDAEAVRIQQGGEP